MIEADRVAASTVSGRTEPSAIIFFTIAFRDRLLDAIFANFTPIGNETISWSPPPS
jgi:hypothetical protein